MLIERVSPVDDAVHTMEINVTPQQIYDWKRGKLIQVVMPNLTANEREFIVSGITPAQWDNMYQEFE